METMSNFAPPPCDVSSTDSTLKKAFSALLALLLVAGVFFVVPVSVSADLGNETYEKATALPLNEWYYGNTVNSKDVDWYTFALESDGYITINFEAPRISSTGWSFYLFNSTTGQFVSYDRQLLNYYFEGSSSIQSGQRVGLPAGKYFIEILPSYNKIMSYSFKIDFTPNTIWEKEPNSTYDFAVPINLNTSYYASTSYRNVRPAVVVNTIYDIDWYTFTLPSEKTLLIYFDYEKFSSSSWIFRLYDATTGQYTSVGGRLYTQTFKTNATPEAIKIRLPAGRYYIEVNPSFLYTYAEYTLKVSDQIPVTDISLTPLSATLCRGQGIDLKASITPGDATNKTVTWSSDKPAIASVDYTGKVTAKSAGTAIITANSSNNKTVKSTITVRSTHAWGAWKVTKAATCTSAGSQNRTCPCGEKQTQSIKALGHSYGSWKVTKKATDTATGIKERSCKRCLATNTATIPKIAAKPKADKKAGTYTKSVKVKMTSSTKGATIYYTTDGKTPTTKSKSIKNGSAITLKKSATLKLMAVKKGINNSEVTSVKYKIIDTTTAPTNSNVPKNKTAKAGYKITLKAPKNADLYYTITTNGKTPATPTTKSTKVTKGKSKTITINKTTKLKAMTIQSGLKKSTVVSRTYIALKKNQVSGVLRKGTWYHDGMREWFDYYYVALPLDQYLAVARMANSQTESSAYNAKQLYEVHLVPNSSVNLNNRVGKTVILTLDVAMEGHTIHHQRDYVAWVAKVS
ncbi:MAG: chitobiase/beta-hexosaminidase C-terminal domain-containing protein [Oscillospiraceae bacterium]|jgi:hypothetical protein|nr:chitobiase/beta-hexosaminidase C-terminal domain-containing protein [Oscillospiraceae bacterium]